jgi:hypothetical protein
LIKPKGDWTSKDLNSWTNSIVSNKIQKKENSKLYLISKKKPTKGKSLNVKDNPKNT